LNGVTILGNNSALPAFDRHPTAQVVTFDDQLFLVDCGEGTQMQLARYRIRWGRINHIFISHLHGDHYFGLAGLLNSMSLLNRTAPLHLYGPPELEQILQLQFNAGDTELKYPLSFHAVMHGGELFANEKCRVRCFPTQHRIACFGFHFEQVKAPRKVNAEKARLHGIPAAYFDRLKKGEDYLNQQGVLIPNASVTDKAPAPKSYAYCADTRYDESIVAAVQGADLLYHEATYLNDLEERAHLRYHSTARQAALIAAKAGVKKLLIGHFSSKYEFLEAFQQEAQSVFEATELALEGVTYKF
jgi:ribonuclease Z